MSETLGPYLRYLLGMGEGGGLGQQNQGYRDRLDANLLWQMQAQQQAREAYSPFGVAPREYGTPGRPKPKRLIDMSGPEAVAHMLADSRRRLCPPYKPRTRELTA